MNSDTFQNSDRHELAHRNSNGLDVSLVWDRATDTVSVCVNDELYDQQFEIEVEPGTSPLAVFTHPFAYAARQGIGFGELEAAA